MFENSGKLLIVEFKFLGQFLKLIIFQKFIIRSIGPFTVGAIGMTGNTVKSAMMSPVVSEDPLQTRKSAPTFKPTGDQLGPLGSNPAVDN